MEKLKKTAIYNLLGVVGVIAGTTALVALGILHPAAFALAAIACYPMVKYLWQYAGNMHRNVIRNLRKALPKAGFSVETSEWNDQHTIMRFRGTYQGEKFIIDAANNSDYIFICDMPWHGVKSSDPILPKFMEAINEVNSDSSNMSVVMAEPDDEEMRYIYTISKTILPSHHIEYYLDSLMCDMLNRKAALAQALNRERPYIAQRRGPVGFNVQKPSVDSDDELSPAAKTDSKI